MNNCSFGWEVQKGDLLYLGDRKFSAKDVNSFSSKEAEAVRSLCNKALNSEQGRQVAFSVANSLESRAAPLRFAVGFKEEKGLLLFVSGVSRVIATAEEVFSGKEGYLESLKQISAFTERRKIGTVSSDACPIFQNVIKEVYKETVQARKEKAEAPILPLLGRVEAFFREKFDAILDKVFGAADIVSVGRNSNAALTPSNMGSFGAMAILGGAFLALGGFYATVASTIELGIGILRKDIEKVGLAFSSVITGICATATGMLFILRGVAYFTKKIAIGALAGFMLPFFVAGLYLCGLISNIYKIYVGYMFRKELQEILYGEGVSREQRLCEALQYIQQKTSLSELDYLESIAHADGDKNAFARMKDRLNQKLDRFALRVGSEVYHVAEGLLNGDDSSALLEEVLEGKEEAVKKAENLIGQILDKSKEQMFWSAFGVFYNLVGSVALIIWITVTNLAGSIASSVIFALAGVLSLFIDMQAARNAAKRAFLTIRERAPLLGKAVIDVVSWEDIINPSILRTLDKIRKRYKEYAEEADRLKEDLCQSPTPEIFSTTSDQSEGSLRTPSNRTEETSLLSQAS